MADDATTRQCPQCGAALPGDAPQGLCPRCLLQNAMLSGGASGSQANTTPTYGQHARTSGQGSYRASGGRFIAPSVEQLSPLFPHLEVLELLGQGGMGAVYKAKQRGLDRLVAVKILPPDLGDIPGFADRFTREARALARLNHPNIVSVYDFGRTHGDGGGPTLPQPLPKREGSETGLYFLVMEFVDGVNLRQAMRANKLSPAEALAIVPQICEALQFAHDEGIVHRDIKPENILLDRRGKVKIADFGLAKLIAHAADDVTLTREGGTMGTPHYMAPEQIEGAHGVDHRADIYSLGVVFYEMLTGELPLGRFAAPSKRVKIDVRLDEIVLRSLEKEPELRYQHASEMKTQVDGLRGMSAAAVERAFGSEYKSKATVLGIPLLHIAYGLDPKTGRKRVARGIVAIGDVAVGVFAFGGAAFGGLAFGGVGIGLISISGVAVALLLAIGGVAIGTLAFGGLAIGGVALGGCAVGYYTWGGASFGIHDLNRSDPPAWMTGLVDPRSNQWMRWLTILSIAMPLLGLFVFLFVWMVLRTQKVANGRGKSGGDSRGGRGNERAEAGGKREAVSPADQSAAIRRQLMLPAVATCLVSPLFLFLAVLLGFNGIDIADGNDATPVVQGYLLIALGAASLLVFALVVRGAWHMFSLTRHGPAVLAGFLTLPIGIWALAVLGRRDVRDAFAVRWSGGATSPPRTDGGGARGSGAFACSILSCVCLLLGLVAPASIYAATKDIYHPAVFSLFVGLMALAGLLGVASGNLGRMAGAMAMVLMLGAIVARSTTLPGSKTMPQAIAANSANSYWSMAEQGPVLNEWFVKSLDLSPQQREKVDEMLQRYFHIYRDMEARHTTRTMQEKGQDVVIEPFPQELDRMEQRMWGEILPHLPPDDPNTPGSPLDTLRANLPLYPKPATPDDERSIYNRGIFGFGRQRLAIVMWKVGDMFYWHVEDEPYYAGMHSDRGKELPEEYRRFWVEPKSVVGP